MFTFVRIDSIIKFNFNTSVKIKAKSFTFYFLVEASLINKYV